MRQWTRSDTIGLAFQKCTQCHGSGMRFSRKRKNGAACNCVLRNIFRICYNRFRQCMEKEKHLSSVSLDFSTCAKDRRYSWGRKDEEYTADFYLVSKRHLNEVEWRIFRFHFLLGADWKLCCQRLEMDRGTFFHAVYRIEQNLGRVFRELEPYPLYPLDEYFMGAVRRADVDPLGDPDPQGPSPFASEKPEDVVPDPLVRKVIPIRPPLARRPEPADTPEQKAA